MDLGTFNAVAVAVVALGVAAVAISLAVGLSMRLSGVQARYRVLWDGGEKDLIAVLSHQSSQIAELHRELEKIRTLGSRTAADVGESLRHVAVVRYDALGGKTGRLSFSAAIIDDRGDGLVFSSIQAVGESRSYAKGVVRGTSLSTLSLEEQQALAAARTGKGAQ